MSAALDQINPARVGAKSGRAGQSSARRLVKPITGPTAPGRAGSIGTQVARLNRWREQYNPLRGITIAQAVNLLETYRRGEFADLQWTYSYIEETDADLFALVERRTSSICEMDWDIKIVPEPKRRADFDETLAAEQAAALRETYDRIDNLTDAVEHLALASFRGYAFAEKFADDAGQINHLELVDHWNLVRDGFRGEWKYNPQANQTNFAGLTGEALPRGQFLWREVPRHIDRVGLIKFLRTGLGEKDWVAFLEIYGIPSGVVIMPPNVPAGKETDYETAAGKIAEGGNGALPNGSDYKANDGPRQGDPFANYLEYFTKKLVLVGTGGQLTMLTESGSGTLAGNAHMEVFKKIAKTEARKINQSFNRDIDAGELALKFPGQPRLAYFALALEEQQDMEKLTNAYGVGVRGGAITPNQEDEGWIRERLGLPAMSKDVLREWKKQGGARTPITIQQEGAQPNGAPPEGGVTRRPDTLFRNRAPDAALLQQARTAVATAVSDDLAPIARRLQRILAIEDPEILRNRLVALRADLPQLLKDINADPESARAFEQTLSSALLTGLTSGPVTNRSRASFPSPGGEGQGEGEPSVHHPQLAPINLNVEIKMPERGPVNKQIIAKHEGEVTTYEVREGPHVREGLATPVGVAVPDSTPLSP